MFFPLDENTKEVGVTEVTDLSKNAAKPIQTPNVTCQNKAFTYVVLKTRHCVLLPCAVVALKEFELCGFTTEPRRL